MRAFTKEAFNRMGLRTRGMEFASEMVIRAKQVGLKITEIPITLYPDGRSGRPHLRSFRDGWRHLRFLLLYAPRWLFLYPGLEPVAVATFVQDYRSNNLSNLMKKRIYWIREGERWKIIHEGAA
jgi:hypothetical protein